MRHAAAVVDDAHDQHGRVGRQFDFDLGGCRMFGNIGQDFTEYAECGVTQVGVDRQVLALAGHHARDFHALLEFGGLPFDRRHQAQFEQRRTQVARDARGDFHGAVDQRLQRLHLVQQLRTLLVEAVVQPQKVYFQRGQVAADVVVHFARNPRALDFLGFLQVGGERRQLLARLPQFVLRLFALRDVFHDAVPLYSVGAERARPHADFDPFGDIAGGDADAPLPEERLQRLRRFRDALAQGRVAAFEHQFVKHAGVVLHLFRRQFEQLVAAGADVGKTRAAIAIALQLKHHAGNVGNNGAEARLAFLEFAPRLAGVAAHHAFAQLALDCRYQARVVAFHHVIVGARAHRFHRDVFADVAGIDDERQVGVVFAHDSKRGQPAELWHLVVADHDVPPLARERLAGCLRGVRAPVYRLVAAMLDFSEQQLGVFVRILDQQNAQRLLHGVECVGVERLGQNARWQKKFCHT